MLIDHDVTAERLLPATQRVFELAADKTAALDSNWNVKLGTPVFTANGKYQTRGWTEWTQGFQYGCMILTGDALDDQRLIELGRDRTIERMLPHVTHIGVHDHGFNNLSTYGNLLRLMNEGRIDNEPWQRKTYENAIAASGAVQAARWSRTSCGLGYIYSFNGPHSLFIDTMRTTRILGVAHQLGHALMGENDARFDLLARSVQHGLVTSKYIVFHGDSSHTYDVRGRTSHEGTFNCNDGNFRARSTQQGYSPFSTWTRGLAWAMLGYAEELEFFKTLPASQFKAIADLTKREIIDEYRRCAIDTCDHYIDQVSTQDGIAYWDDGAPTLHRLGDWRSKKADPLNDFEPVDSSASVIAAQGLIRLGNFLGGKAGKRYLDAGLSVASVLFNEPYLSTDESHQGLLLHSIYHWPNRWDHIPKGREIASGESSMWGDYHLLELALLIQRIAKEQPYPVFFLDGK